MSVLSGKQRTKIAVGGLLVSIGFFVFLLPVFHLAQIVDLSPMIENDLFINFMIVLAIFTLVIGVLLLRKV
jgi:hypothetical protein